MPDTSDTQIMQLNVIRFRELLATELDDATRQTVERLLAKAQVDLDEATSRNKSDPSAS